MTLPSVTSTAPSVVLTHPPRSLFQFPPNPDPQPLSPLQLTHSTVSHPFNISPQLYSDALSFEVPATIALIYAVTVTYFNRVNKERGYKPWAFSKSTIFRFLVVMHNLFLAVYSAWTFIGMFNAIRNSWPGWDGEFGLAGVADGFCKINGPRGFGSAATYDMGSSAWKYTDKAMKLLGGHPDSTDVGRIWNEGLAYYGWLFYLSKFYEVMDTAIILTKGKRSGGLQTYHHAGAMISMWAGIRFMSPPIWMFVFVNSGLHVLMYTYYALFALGVQVPQYMKKILTGLQITQILVGCSYALAHLFIAYDIPVEMPYLYVHNLSTALPSTASTISSAVSSALTSATATAGVASWLKKAALRAAGEEGLAENVRNDQGQTFGIDAIHAADVEKAQEEIRYRRGSQKIHCIDTSGEAFAILLNAIYLIPLFGFFIRFFYKSYVSRAHAEAPKPNVQENVKQSSKDALKNVEKTIKNDIDEQGGLTEPSREDKVKGEQSTDGVSENASNTSNKVLSEFQDFGEKAKEKANNLGAQTLNATGDLPAKIQESFQNLGSMVPESLDKAKDTPDDISNKAAEMGQHAKKLGGDPKEMMQKDLKALQERSRKPDSADAKSNGTENSLPNGDTKSRNKSPEKASQPRQKSSEKKAPIIRDKSPEKKLPAPRDKSPEKRPISSRGISPEKKAPTLREKSPEKRAIPPREPSPVKAPASAPEPVEEPKKDSALEEKKSSPDLAASSYEIIPDEPKTEEERKAEAEMQPNLGDPVD